MYVNTLPASMVMAFGSAGLSMTSCVRGGVEEAPLSVGGDILKFANLVLIASFGTLLPVSYARGPFGGVLRATLGGKESLTFCLSATKLSILSAKCYAISQAVIGSTYSSESDVAVV